MRMTATLMLSMAAVVGAGAQSDPVRVLMTKDQTGVPGKELAMLTVTYAPGASSPAHIHRAQALVYVLEGSIVMQIKGRPQVTLGPGESFYEGRGEEHVVSRNASTTLPAKYVVFLAKDKEAPILEPRR